MPYIRPERRAALDAYVDAIATHYKETAKEGSWIGDLTYTMTRLTTRTLRVMFKEIRYWQIVIVIGILQSMIIEFYRRVASPYENRQCGQYGDVAEFTEYDLDAMPVEEAEADEATTPNPS